MLHSNFALALCGWFMLGDLTAEGRLSRKRKKLKTSESLASLFLDAIAYDTDVVCNLNHDNSSLCRFSEDFSYQVERRIIHNGSQRQPRSDGSLLSLQNAKASRKGRRQGQRHQDCCSEYV
ncbi:hypothetical protein Q1695_002533 [Nippostrongylus brasiliensis]|nr:hypothetical protein Q1695_002533 [Nippostrongylus brasiliensis]